MLRKLLLLFVLPAILVFAAVLGIQAYGGQPFDVFAGKRPSDLGVLNGQLKGCGTLKGCVSSSAPFDDAPHYIAPFKHIESPTSVLQRFADQLSAAPRVRIITATPFPQGGGYIHAEYTSEALGFVDDLELYVMADPPNLVLARSASRISFISDHGVNRARIERMRGWFTTAVRSSSKP